MFLTDEQVATRVSSLDNLVNRLQVRKLHNNGRPKGRKNDTKEKQLEVAEDAIILGPTIAAEKHDTTISRASLLSNGVTTHGNGANEELAEKVVETKDKVHNRALDIVMASLGLLGEKIEQGEVTKPRDLSAIASDMAKIAEKTGGRLNKDEADKKPQVQVIVYAPRMKDVSEYEIVDSD